MSFAAICLTAIYLVSTYASGKLGESCSFQQLSDSELTLVHGYDDADALHASRRWLRVYGSSDGDSRRRRSRRSAQTDERVVRVLGVVEPPYVNYLNLSAEMEAERGYTPGVIVEILREFGRTHNLRFELVEQDTGNGSWSRALERLRIGEAQLMAGATIIRSDRAQTVDFSFPFLHSETGMLIRSPEMFNRNTFLIVTAPFAWQVWALTAGCVVASGCVLKLLVGAFGQPHEAQYSLFGSVWVFFSICVQQGLPVQPRTWACRALLAFWWMASLTLIATFTGSLVALFAVERVAPPFADLEGLVSSVRHGGYTLLLDRNTMSRTMFIKTSKRQLLQQLWTEMSENGKVAYVDSLEQGIEIVKSNPRMVLLGPKDTLQVMSFVDCDVMVLDKGILPVWLSIPLAFDSPLTDDLSALVLQLVEKGFIIKWMNDYKTHLASKSRLRCDAAKGIRTRGFLDLDRAQGAFWSLLAGAVLAGSGLLLEFLFKLARAVLGCVGRANGAAADADAAPQPSQTSVRALDSSFHPIHDEQHFEALRTQADGADTPPPYHESVARRRLPPSLKRKTSVNASHHKNSLGVPPAALAPRNSYTPPTFQVDEPNDD